MSTGTNSIIGCIKAYQNIIFITIITELNNINLSQEDIKSGLMEAKLNRLAQGRSMALSARQRMRMKRGGSPVNNFWREIGKIRDGIIKLYTSNNKLQLNPPIFTSIIGRIIYWDGKRWSGVNKLDYPILQNRV